MVQYADDLTAFVSDIQSAQDLFKLLDQFEKCSGLKVNYTKTEAMWIGSSRNNTETPLALKWRMTVKALGVHSNYNNKESLQKNFYNKLRGIKSQICLWSWRGLSLFAKVTIINSFLLPKVLYDAICRLCKFKNLLNLNFNKMMMMMIIHLVIWWPKSN